MTISKNVCPSARFRNVTVTEDGSASGVMCPPLWDRASCFPATPAGTLSVIPCMAEFKEIYYDTSGKAAAGNEFGAK
jgi:hypothetical protein